MHQNRIRSRMSGSKPSNMCENTGACVSSSRMYCIYLRKLSTSCHSNLKSCTCIFRFYNSFRIAIDALPNKPDLTTPYEEDYHRIDQVYLAAKGNFWIAWMDDLPVGNIGAEDKG